MWSSHNCSTPGLIMKGILPSLSSGLRLWTYFIVSIGAVVTMLNVFQDSPILSCQLQWKLLNKKTALERAVVYLKGDGC